MSIQDVVRAHPTAARIARHAIRYVGIASLLAAAELVATAIVSGQPIPDLRTIEFAALGPATLGTVRILQEIETALGAPDVPAATAPQAQPLMGNRQFEPRPPR